MTVFSDNSFVILVIAAMTLFSVVLGYVSIADREPGQTPPAE